MPGALRWLGLRGEDQRDLAYLPGKVAQTEARCADPTTVKRRKARALAAVVSCRSRGNGEGGGSVVSGPGVHSRRRRWVLGGARCGGEAVGVQCRHAVVTWTGKAEGGGMGGGRLPCDPVWEVGPSSRLKEFTQNFKRF
jgi:hypothetical protein